MIYISHRGNVTEIKPELENTPGYISAAINLGFDVEIDVRKINNKWFLGHDYPEHEIGFEFLLNEKLWIHAKNLNALTGLLDMGVKCFWHQEDNFTLTSNNYIWTYPGQALTNKSICVMPEKKDSGEDLSICAGICSDKIDFYRRKYA